MSTENGGAAGGEIDPNAGAGAAGAGASGGEGANGGAAGAQGAAGSGAAGAAGAANGGAGAGDSGAVAGAGAAQPDWRARLAGDDKDFLKTLGRYSDEAAFGKAHRALHAKLSSGEFKRALAENASDEERATWRKENGIPETAEAYVSGLALPDGIVIGEEDKPIVAGFAQAAHAANVDPKAFSGLVAQYYAMQDQQAQQRADADATFKETSEEELRTLWGADFKRNVTAVENMLAGWPQGLADAIRGGRDAAGNLIGNNPAFIRQMAELARELNPLASLVPAGTTDAAKTAAGRLDEIREIRRSDPDRYDADKKMQAEELQLIEATQKLKNRAA